MCLQGYTRDLVVRKGYIDEAVVLSKEKQPDPQLVTIPGVAYAMKAIVLFNLTMAVIYMQWRWSKTIKPLADERLFNASWLPALP